MYTPAKKFMQDQKVEEEEEEEYVQGEADEGISLGVADSVGGGDSESRVQRCHTHTMQQWSVSCDRKYMHGVLFIPLK